MKTGAPLCLVPGHGPGDQKAWLMVKAQENLSVIQRRNANVP